MQAINRSVTNVIASSFKAGLSASKVQARINRGPSKAEVIKQAYNVKGF